MEEMKSYKALPQYLFLTFKKFFENYLLSFASDCAFGFLFSAIPILMMIITALVRVFNATPEAVSALLGFLNRFSEYFDANAFVDSVFSVEKLTSVEVLLGISIFLMARRFFASLTRSMSCIFHTKVSVRPLYTQIFIIISEIVLVIIIALFFIIIFSFRSFFMSSLYPILISESSKINGILSNALLQHMPYILMTLFIFIFYRFGSGVQPKGTASFSSAFLCTITFFLLQKILHAFFGYSQYNYIYGMLVKLMLLLIEVYAFFILFLFFAEFLFVTQFYDEITAERELLAPIEPDSENPKFPAEEISHRDETKSQTNS